MNSKENNSTSTPSMSTEQTRVKFGAEFNLLIIVLGLIGNLTSFVIFRFHPSFKKMPSMVFLSFVAVSDTIALFEWNLNHFTLLVYDLELSSINLAYCRIYTFVQYASLQTSALVLSIMCIDRYVTVMAMPGSFLHKLPFRTNRNAVFWSCGVILFTILLNLHILIYCGVYESIPNSLDKKLNCFAFSNGLEISRWDQINMVFYNIIPFLIMITFNSVLIVNIRKKFSNQTSKSTKATTTPTTTTNSSSSSNRKANLTISLVVLSFLFLIMTIPGTMLFAFFYDQILVNLDPSVVFIIDDISFLNHSILFLVCFVSNKKFRNTILQILCCRASNSTGTVSGTSSSRTKSTKSSPK